MTLADRLLPITHEKDRDHNLISGFWDWFAGHSTKVRWHAITGVVLAILLLIHMVRRWSRLRRSKIPLTPASGVDQQWNGQWR